MECRTLSGMGFLMAVSCLGLTLSVDYCDPLLCDSGKLHVGCNATDDFGESCPTNAEVVPMDDKLKELILDMHNSLRSELASGKMEGFNSAEQMPTLVRGSLV